MARRLILLPAAAVLLTALALPARADECAYIKWNAPVTDHIVYVGESGSAKGGVDGFEYTAEGKQRPENVQGKSWDCKGCVPLQTSDVPDDPLGRNLADELAGLADRLEEAALIALRDCRPPDGISIGHDS